MSKRPRSRDAGGGGGSTLLGKLSLTAARRTAKSKRSASLQGGGGSNNGRPSSAGSSSSSGSLRRRRQRSSSGTAGTGNSAASASSSAGAMAPAKLAAAPFSLATTAIPKTKTSGSRSSSTSRRNSRDQQEQPPTKLPPAAENNNSSKSNSDGGDDGQQIRLESLTLHLSSLTSKRDSRRLQLQGLFEQMQTIRSQMTEMESDLHGLDEEIDGVETEIRRLVRGNGTGDGCGDNDTERAEQQPMTMQYAPTQLSPTQPSPTQPSQSQSQGGFVGHTQDVGTQDYDDGEEKKESSDGEGLDRRGHTPPRTMAPPDEFLTDPASATRGSGDGAANNSSSGAPHDDDEMDMIANHYDDDGDMEGSGPPPPPEYDDFGTGNGGGLFMANSPAPMPAAAASSAPAFDVEEEPVRPRSSDSDVIELGTVYHAALPEGMQPSLSGNGNISSNSNTNSGRNGMAAAAAAGGRSDGTLDSFFSRSGGGSASAATHNDNSGGILAHITTPAATSSSASALDLRRPTRDDRNAAYMQHLACDNFPWSQEMAHHLRNTFRIQSFRDNQKEIINATMSGDDAFVLMRTGGGKSLTYQLPALLEGRGQQRKVTLVISPLKSLIHDQVEQMNGFVPGSAVCFMSGMGKSEHTQRWNQVRDRNGGICLIFCTPEKVTKSNMLRSELEKLNKQGRLGRFVIDEAHCCTQYGHDFRPDYTQLGIFKKHFPAVPLIAVTATASDRVRQDCARILHIGTNYQLFRSTANRHNITYSVRLKADNSQKVIDEMIDFIKTEHRNEAGIIYTFSKKEAEDVADKLVSGGIIARPYHSDVPQARKDQTHRSWMRNQTQVVVATIAFGLGINKPDVRFVLHHSMSKSLEGYYQESGRAGRDGLPADAVLYYSTKDVYRMIGMIHGSHGEGGFFDCIRYAQAFGDDALCKAILMSALGEPGSDNLQSIVQRGCDRTERREVGKHCKVLATLIDQSSDLMTAQQIVTLWRSKKNAPAHVAACPPSPDLTKDECDRIIVSLMLERVFEPKVVFNAYGSNVYVILSERGGNLVRHPNPKCTLRFLKRKEKSTAKRTSSSTSKRKSKSKKSSTPSPAQADETGWIRSSEKKKRKQSSKSTGSKKSAKGSRKKKKTNADEVIVLSSSDGEEDSDQDKKRPARTAKQGAKEKMKKDIFDDSSDSEYEFE